MHEYPLIAKQKNNQHDYIKYPLIIAGPCSIENLEDMKEYCELLLKNNIHYVRAALFKPRTSPHDFQGLQEVGLFILKKLKELYPIKLVTEVTDSKQLELIQPYVDVIQIGARNMQNFELLKKVGKTDKVILLKRGFANTIDEWLGACEYIMENGNSNIILCERGIRTFDSELRNTLDLAGAVYTKQLTNLPVIIDPSHATGRSSLIEPLSLASLSAGLDGIMIEIHKNPQSALSDGAQSITLPAFQNLIDKINKLLSNN